MKLRKRAPKRFLVARRMAGRVVTRLERYHAVSAGPEALSALCGLIPRTGSWGAPRPLSVVNCERCREMMDWAAGVQP
jgi:hypothetical protein